jgi:hypothetical protein
MLSRVARFALAFAVISAGLTAPAAADGLVARFSAVTANINIGTGQAGQADTVRVDLLRWSTDKERDTLVAALTKGETALADALQKMPVAGYFWTSSSVGFTVRYAYDMTAGAEETVVLAIDGHPDSGGPAPWRVLRKTTMDRPFTVIEIRMRKGQPGQGKLSLATGIADKVSGGAAQTGGGATQASAGTAKANEVPAAADKTIALEDYAAAPVMLQNVKRLSLQAD